jgi:hypothetical protein
LIENPKAPAEHGTAQNNALTLSEIRTNDQEFQVLEQQLDAHWREYVEINARLGASRYAVGQTLSAIHNKLAHGNWQKWLEEKGIPRSTADDIMRDYRRIAEDVKPSATVLEIAAVRNLDIAQKKYSNALDEHKEELQVTTDRDKAEELLTTIETQSRRTTKSSKTDFMERVTRICDARWKEKADSAEMLQLLERLATLYGLAPVMLKAYRSVEEVPRKLPEAITMQKEVA